MKDSKVKVFLILKGLNSIERVPIHSFITNNREMAILYLNDYLKNQKEGYYSLHEVLSFEKNTIKNNDIFITAKWNNKLPRQTIKEEQKSIMEAFKQKEQSEIIKKLFNAVEVQGDKQEISELN